MWHSRNNFAKPTSLLRTHELTFFSPFAYEELCEENIQVFKHKKKNDKEFEILNLQTIVKSNSRFKSNKKHFFVRQRI